MGSVDWGNGELGRAEPSELKAPIKLDSAFENGQATGNEGELRRGLLLIAGGELKARVQG